jgi:amino acid transporter
MGQKYEQLGTIIIMLIALCFAELVALFPRSGALVHISHPSHGEGLGRIWCWLLFLTYVPVPAVETEAIVTYADTILAARQPIRTGIFRSR